MVGSVLSVGGAVTAVVYFFQPWRTCPDGSSAACPMLPLDSQIMLAAMLMTLFGIILLAVGLTLRTPLPPKDSQR